MSTSYLFVLAYHGRLVQVSILASWLLSWSWTYYLDFLFTTRCLLCRFGYRELPLLWPLPVSRLFREPVSLLRSPPVRPRLQHHPLGHRQLIGCVAAVKEER